MLSLLMLEMARRRKEGRGEKGQERGSRRQIRRVEEKKRGDKKRKPKRGKEICVTFKTTHTQTHLTWVWEMQLRTVEVSIKNLIDVYTKHTYSRGSNWHSC